MKLLKQKILYFSEGKSDKVYQVDLCESGSDLFVVNFKYGRRDANLREGTKTVFPVPFDEAEKIFDKLVLSKEKKGYSENENAKVTTSTKKTNKPKANTAREETILTYLKEANQGTYTRNWKVSRIILRTVALDLNNAVPLIQPFVFSQNEFEQYAAIYALTNFKDKSAVVPIFKLFQEIGLNGKVGRIAAAFLLRFGNETHLKYVKERVNLVKPDDFSLNKETFTSSLAMHLMKESNVDASIIYYAYLLTFSKDRLRNQLYAFIQKTPLKVNTFKSIRYIYRAAEIVQDISFLALISKRIAISSPVYSSYYFYDDKGAWGYADEEKKKPNPRIAFSAKTKGYFNKASYKLAYHLSLNDTDKYIDFATQLLCSLDDNLDKQKKEVQYFYNYDYDTGDYSTEKRYYPKYNHFLALMYIAYGGSSRIQSNGTKWYYTEETPKKLPREEALQEIWNTKPQEVLTILANAKSEIAIQFALRIIEDNPNFLDSISDEIMTKLVRHYEPKVLDIILNVLKEKYKTKPPETHIIIALLQSENEQANTLALDWIKQYEVSYFSSGEFITKIILTNKDFVIDYLIELYKTEVKYKVALKTEEFNSLFENHEDYNYDYLIKVNYLFGDTFFGELLSNTSEKEIYTLANSTVTTNKLFAANLSKHNKIPTYQLFKDTFDSYINSDKEIIRKAGIELLAYFPDTFLLENKHQISAYCFSEYEEVRTAIQPSIERLIQLDKQFKESLLKQLIKTIVAAEKYDGIHKNSYAVLLQFYDKNLPQINDTEIVDLVLSKYDFAQKLGTPLFKERIILKDFTMEQLVELSTSDVLEIRELLHRFFNDNIARINYELEAALRIFNTPWQDVIDWSCTFFEKHIEAKNWTIEMLLYVSDHTNKKVQAFGRKMITTHFSEDKGLPLLLKLQEHPTKEMQFFVTNYLDNYASGKPEVILQLEHFFKTSLFNINTNRTTKTRVYAFLEQESIKDKTVASMTIRIINSILGTKTIRDNSHNIDLLLAIKDSFPEIEIPLTIKSI